MSRREYTQEESKEILDLAQKMTGCRLSTYYGCDIYTTDEVLASLVPHDALELLPNGTYSLTSRHAGASEIFTSIHSCLQLLPHYSLRCLYRYIKDDGIPYWYVSVFCEKEPYPTTIGWDYSRADEDIWQYWYLGERISCHGIGKVSHEN